MNSLPSRVFFVLTVLGILITGIPARAVDDEKLVVGVNVSTSPAPQVVLTWDDQTDGVVIQIYRRLLPSSAVETGESSFQLVATVEHPLKSHVDTTVVAGNAYEYKIHRPQILDENLLVVLPETAAFLAVTIDSPLEDARGTVLLVVDNTIIPELTAELTLLEMDLVGDGWNVRRMDFSPHGVGTPQNLKSAIVAAHAEDPSINALYLFGRLPVARSGLLAPDGHFPNRAHETDLYYASLFGTWTDSTVNVPAAGHLENENIPGDGKFDQSVLTGKFADLMTGRVDFYKMTAYRKNEREYLRDYIQKSHTWRHAFRPVVAKAVLEDENYLFMEHNWLMPMFGSDNVTANTPFQPILNTESRLWGVSFPNFDGADEAHYGAVDNRGIFFISFGSYKQMWHRENNPMRALLAQADWGLTAAWGARPAWHMHHMAAGKPVGYSALQTINNSGSDPKDYFPTGDFSTGFDLLVSNNLMGDPTLRQHPVMPPSQLSCAGSGTSASLFWTASADPSLVGYHVYRATNRLGPYTRLTTSPLAPGTASYTDTGRPAADVYYQVRSVALTRTSTGTYNNQSQGIFAILKADGSTNAAPAVTSPATLQAASNTPTPIAFPEVDADGDALTPIVLSNPSHGLLRWSFGKACYISNADYVGSDSFIYQLSDGINLSAPMTASIEVEPTRSNILVGWKFGIPAPGTFPSPASTYNHPHISAATIAKGAGLSLSTTDSNNKNSYYVTGANSSSMDLPDYLGWTVAPITGVRQSISKIVFFACAGGAADKVLDDYSMELRVSTDGFASYQVITLDQPGATQGIHSGQNGGRIYSADVSSISSLQAGVTPVEFRLYVWNADAFGFGKSGDNSVQTAADIVVFGSTDPLAPVASAGADQFLTDNPGIVQLDGTNSTGFDLSYNWTQLSGPAVVLNGASTATPTLPAATPGTYVFQLIAGNTVGTSTDTVTVSIAPGDVAPFVSGGPSFSSAVDSVITLHGTASDADHDEISTSWSQISGPAVSLVGTDTASVSFTPSEPGIYIFSLSATGNGVTSTNEVTITVFGDIPTLYWGGGTSTPSNSVNVSGTNLALMSGQWNAFVTNWNQDPSSAEGYRIWADGSHARFKSLSTANPASPDVEVAANISAAGIIGEFANSPGNQQFDLVSADASNRTVTLARDSAVQVLSPNSSSYPAFRRSGFVSGRGAVLLDGTDGFTFNGLTTGGLPSASPLFVVESSTLSGPVVVNSGVLSIGSTSSGATGMAGVERFDVIGNLASLRVNWQSATDNRLHDNANLHLANGLFSFVASSTGAPLETIGKLTLNGSGILVANLGQTSSTQTGVLHLAHGISRGPSGKGVLVVSNGTTSGTQLGGLGVTSGNGFVLTGHGLGSNALLSYGLNYGRAAVVGGGTTSVTSTGFLATDSSGNLLVRAAVPGSAILGDSSWQAFHASSDVMLDNATLSGALSGDVTVRTLAVSVAASGTLDLGGRQLSAEGIGFGDNSGRNLTIGTASANRGSLVSSTGELYLVHRRQNAVSNSSVILNSVIAGATDVIFGGGNGQFQLATPSTYTGKTFVHAGLLTLNSGGALPNTSEINLASGSQMGTTAVDFELGRGGVPQTLSGGGHIPGVANVRADTRLVTFGRKGVLAPGAPDANAFFSFAFTTGKLVFEAGSTLALDLNTPEESDRVSFTTAGDWLAGAGMAHLVLLTGSGFDYTKTYTIFENVTTGDFSFASITGHDSSNHAAFVTKVGSSYLLSFAPIPAIGSAEPATIAFSATTYSANENAGTATITVTRTGGTAGAVSVDYAIGNGTATAGSDYTAASGTLNWADGDGASKSFTVSISNDLVDEPDETVTLTLSNATGGEVTGTASTMLTIMDDDPSFLLAVSTGGISVTGTGGSAVNATLTATGGTGPYAWSVTSGALPIGITLSDTGVLSGSTMQTGTFNVTVQASDTSGNTDTQEFTLIIDPPGSGMNHPPVISAIPDLRTTPGAAVPQQFFTIGDVETAETSLIVTASSSNQTLLPDANIMLRGSGADRSVTLTPAAGQSGLTTVTCTVTDANGKSSARTFTLTVASSISGNTAPLISGIRNQTLAQGMGSGAQFFTIGDAETTFNSLVLGAVSSNDSLIPNTPTNLALGGDNAQRTLIVTPAAGQTGRSVVTVSVSDGAFTSSTAFVVDVIASGTAPTLSGLPGHQLVLPGQMPTALPFTVDDAQAAAADLVVRVSSTNLSLVPLANITLGGSGTNRTVQITPVPGLLGASVIALTVSDPDGMSTTAEFIFSVFDDTGTNNSFSQPSGLYVLDGSEGSNINGVSMRDANVSNLPFVDGYVLRTDWGLMEPVDGQAPDFTIISNIFSKLPADQKLSLIVSGIPTWLTTLPGITTWTGGNPAVTKPKPWDAISQERLRLFLIALGNHPVDGIPLRDHPRLAALNIAIPGLSHGIRDPEIKIRDIPGYSRENMNLAVLRHLANVTDNFPAIPLNLGFWTYEDNQDVLYGNIAPWEQIRQEILAVHNDVLRKRIGFWMENLAANRTAAESTIWNGLPNTSFSAPLFLSQNSGHVGYQMLGSWSKPFSSAHVDNNLNGSPEDGFDHGFNTFQTRYFEIYQADVDFSAMQPEFQRWHDFLAALPPSPSLTLQAVLSRKMHGAVGETDILLNTAIGSETVESRSGGTGNNYTLVFVFDQAVESAGAALISGTGSIVAGSPVFDPENGTVAVDLTGVSSGQKITVRLSDLNGIVGRNVEISLRILVGDTTGDRRVNIADIAQTQSRSGQVVGAANFRSDVNGDGLINIADIALVQSRSGGTVP